MEEDKPLVAEAEIEDDKASNNGAGSTASQSSEEFVKVNQDDASDDTATDTPHEVVEDLPPLKQAEQTEAGFGERIMSKIDTRDDAPTDSMSNTENLACGESPLENDAKTVDGGLTESSEPDLIELAGHPSFEPAPAASFVPQCVDATEVPECSVVASDNTDAVERLAPEALDTETGESETRIMASENAQKPDIEEKEALRDDVVAGQQVVDKDAIQVFDVSDSEEEGEMFAGAVQDAPVVLEDVQAASSPPDESKSAGSPTTESVTAASSSGEPVEKGVTEHQSDPVVDLVYWRDVKKSAAVFSFLLLMLVSLTCCSVISVAAYAALSLLAVTVGVRLYRLVLQTLNGTQQPHPFQGLLDLDLSLSPERAEKYAGLVSSHMNCCVGTTRDLLLVKNTLSSLKFAVFLWLLTYIGACFNGLTLLIIAVILTFAVPPVYEKYQTQIDGYYGVAKEKIVDLYGKVMAKLPGKKEKTQ